MASVEVKQIGKSFGATTVLHKLDLSIRSGEFLVLVGPSGCGKSTLLRMIAGLEEATSGDVLIDGTVVNEKDPKDRGVAMVFQNYALYPHMSVRDNMAFSLKLAKVPKADIDGRIADAARVLGLEPLLERKPGQLSGGQKQRVAMGRAMVRRPKVFLFDEPLSNLDAQLRVKMRSEISLLHRRLKSTSIYVTHDQVEAMTLADRIAVMYGGKLEQVGTPLEVYHSPKTRFVASFIGTPSMNFLPAEFFPRVAVPAGTGSVGFRPETTEINKDAHTESISLGPAKVALVEPLGALAHVHVSLGEHMIVSEMKTADAPAVDAAVVIRLKEKDLFYFGKDGQRV